MSKPLAVVEYGDTKPPRLALHLTESLDPPTSWGGRYWVFRANVVSIDPEDNTPRNLTSDRQPLAGFNVRAQTDDKREAPGAYGAEIVVDHLGDLNVRDAERILATFRILSRRCEAFTARLGQPRDLAGFVMMAADAMGILTFVVTTARGSDGFYSSGQYAFMNAAEACSKIDSMEREAFRALRPEVTA